MKTKLKGGSLSETFLINDPLLYNGKSFVRKSVSLTQNREYGFQRWYSQLKKLQRYSVMFPGLFPSILKYGMEGDFAYFDIEYIENSITAHEFLMTTEDIQKISLFTDSLIAAMQQLHSVTIPSNSECIKLYLYEEVEQKLQDCQTNPEFVKFLNYKTIYFNNESINNDLTFLFKTLNQSYVETTECFTAGNLTLENILYNQEKNKIIFIDPYEENIIDSKLADYSQLMQSCNSNYEIYNNHPVKIINNCIDCKIKINFGLSYFRSLFYKYLRETCNSNQLVVIKLLECTQYLRMAPFKMSVAPDRMILFYGLALKLLDDIQSKNNVIYALLDPNEGKIRYIGQAINLKKRMIDHYKPSHLKHNTYKNNWLKSLLIKNQKADVIILQECETREELNQAEIMWINHYRKLGFSLTNDDDGGAGRKNYKCSDETKRKISEIKTGRKVSERTKLKQSISAKGKNTWTKGKSWKLINGKRVWSTK